MGGNGKNVEYVPEKDGLPFIKGKRVELIPASSVPPGKYTAWMNDGIVRRYARQMIPLSYGSIKKFFGHKFSVGYPNEVLFAIRIRDENGVPRAIGVVGAGHIDWVRKFCWFYLSIGDKKYWSKGYATEAVKLFSRYIFEELKLNLMLTGIFEPNIASRRAAKKAGFKEIGKEGRAVYIDGTFYDAHIVKMTAEEYFTLRKEGERNEP